MRTTNDCWGLGAGFELGRTYGYDVCGNRAVTANSGLPTSPLMPTATTNFSASTNRLTLTGARYDNAGNLTATSLGDTLAYDAENRLASYTLSSATTSYKYGPQGRRVQKVTPTVTETYVYDAFGKLAAEYSTAAPTSGGTFYRTTDHLGSTRLVTKQDKSDADCYDYAPFGEEIPNTLGGRNSNTCFAASFDGRHRFTGKERDDESDLDYFLARYYSGPLGRFLSIDPESTGVDPTFPQTWNAYAYVTNNPLAMVDPDGRDALWITDKRTRQTTLVIPVRFTGSAATQQNVNAIVKRANSLTVEGSPVRVEVIATEKPIHGVLNTLDFSPGKDPQYGPQGEGVRLGGTRGHINSKNQQSTGAAAHEVLHFAGITDQYKLGTDSLGNPIGIPNPGYKGNIMAERTGTTLKARAC